MSLGDEWDNVELNKIMVVFFFQYNIFCLSKSTSTWFQWLSCLGLVFFVANPTHLEMIIMLLDVGCLGFIFYVVNKGNDWPPQHRTPDFDSNSASKRSGLLLHMLKPNFHSDQYCVLGRVFLFRAKLHLGRNDYLLPFLSGMLVLNNVCSRRVHPLA